MSRRLAPLPVVAVVALPVLASACAGEADRPRQGRTLLEARQAWERAIEDGDPERILSFWSEDVVIYPVSRPAVRGIEAVREFMVRNRRELGLTPRIETEEVVAAESGELGYVRGRYAWVDREGRAREPGDFVELWRRDEGGEWRCFLEIHSPRPEGTSEAEPAAGPEVPAAAGAESGAGAVAETGTEGAEERNKRIVRRVLRDGVNAHDLDVFREMLAPDYARHSQATTEMPEIRGVEQMLDFLRAAFTAFPDWHEEVELMIAEGDLVAYITTGTGTHLGPMGAIPPTGKPVEVVNFLFQRIEDGKIAETWITWDNLATLMQLGLSPAAEGGGG